MLDSILKYLPLLIFIVPLLSWLDKAKRFAHRRKYFVDLLEAAKTYLAEINRPDITDFEKECSAQALASSEKVGFKEVDYLIKHHPSRFFILVRKLVLAKRIIKVKEVSGELKVTSTFSRHRLIKILWLMVAVYLSSMLVIKFNYILVLLIDQTDFLHPFIVEGWVILSGDIISILLGILLAIVSGALYLEVEAAIEVYDELDVVKVPNTSTGFRFFPEP